MVNDYLFLKILNTLLEILNSTVKHDGSVLIDVSITIYTDVNSDIIESENEKIYNHNLYEEKMIERLVVNTISKSKATNDLYIRQKQIILKGIHQFNNVNETDIQSLRKTLYEHIVKPSQQIQLIFKGSIKF